jgi:glycosyltransferase involved in cell wall biosynthesis
VGELYRYVILQNIIAPYKTLLFNTLSRRMQDPFLVAYLSDTAGNRDWRVAREEIGFPFEVISPGCEEEAAPLRVAAATYRLLVRHDPEVVVLGGYNYPAYWAGFWWARRRGRKVIVIVESHFLDRPRRQYAEWFKRALVSRCDAALVDGTRHREYVASLGLPVEAIFVKNGTGPVDLEFFRTEVDRLRPERENLCSRRGIPPRNFLYVGRFSPEKNIPALLEAYRRVRAGRADGWGLILLGDGPQRKEIEGIVSSRGIPDVWLPGFRQKEELPLYYVMSDALVLPSLSEPWGLVAIEAMAAGLPVLVSNRCGCYPDAVREGVNGFSFDPSDAGALSGRMEAFSSGEADLRAMGRESLAIVQEYGPQPCAGKFLEAFRYVESKEREPKA